MAKAAGQNPLKKKAVVLLISLDPKDNPKGFAGLFHNYSKYPQKLAATFKSAFEHSGFQFKIVQNATRYDLFQALHSSENAGVFWLSHEAPAIGKKDSIVDVSSSLLDYQLSDVKPLFEEMNPNIRWVSIIACDSDLVIDWLKGHAETSTIHGFDTPVDAKRGLKKEIALAMPTLEEALADNTPRACPETQGYAIKIHRELKAGPAGGSYFPAVSIAIAGSHSEPKIIAAFPEQRLGDGEENIQDQEAYIPEAVLPQTRAHALQIVVDSGLSPIGLPDGFQMGTFSVHNAWEGAEWQVFAIDGAPVGVTEQILNFVGTIPSDLMNQSFQPDTCG